MYDLSLHLNERVSVTYHHLVTAPNLLFSLPSAFGRTAALLSRGRVFYVPERSSWAAEAFILKDWHEAKLQSLCVRGPPGEASFGAQAWAQMTGIVFCLRKGSCCYRATPMREVSGGAPTGDPAALSAFLGFQSTPGCELRQGCDWQQAEAVDAVATLAHPNKDKWFTPASTALMYSWYAAAPGKPAPQNCTLAVHLRQALGEAVNTDKKGATNNKGKKAAAKRAGRYVNAIESILAQREAGAGIGRARVCLFADERTSGAAAYYRSSAYDLSLHLDAPMAVRFHALVTAPMLLLEAKHKLRERVAAVLSRGQVFYVVGDRSDGGADFSLKSWRPVVTTVVG